MASKFLHAAAVAAFVSAGLHAPSAAAADFQSVVAQVLQGQQTGPVSKLPADRKLELIACVNQVLTDLPNGKKRFVVEAASFDEMQDRFGDVVMENRAEWKQKIARSCSHIVV